MLNSLYIRNFRNLEELAIESLGRVNLITGKNNTGKSSVLEALIILISEANIRTICQLLEERGEIQSTQKHEYFEQDVLFRPTLKNLICLFTNRKIDFENLSQIYIGENEVPVSQKDWVTIEIRHDKSNSPDIANEKEYELVINLMYNFPLKHIHLGLRTSSIDNEENKKYNYQYVKPSNICNTLNPNSNLFDNIILTEKEQPVIDALKIIEPKTQRIAFVQENGHRKAVIKLKDNPEVLPLQSMGDGINRILTIILALVNCEKGYLLIDEFENGLHHTVQEQLWRVIFYLAEKLDIQVFATTHSWDCIEAYENVLNDEETKTDGKLIRLEHKNDKIRAVEFRKSQLKSATEFGIEIR